MTPQSNYGIPACTTYKHSYNRDYDQVAPQELNTSSPPANKGGIALALLQQPTI